MREEERAGKQAGQYATGWSIRRGSEKKRESSHEGIIVWRGWNPGGVSERRRRALEDGPDNMPQAGPT